MLPACQTHRSYVTLCEASFVSQPGHFPRLHPSSSPSTSQCILQRGAIQALLLAPRTCVPDRTWRGETRRVQPPRHPLRSRLRPLVWPPSNMQRSRTQLPIICWSNGPRVVTKCLLDNLLCVTDRCNRRKRERKNHERPTHTPMLVQHALVLVFARAAVAGPAMSSVGATIGGHLEVRF